MRNCSSANDPRGTRERGSEGRARDSGTYCGRAPGRRPDVLPPPERPGQRVLGRTAPDLRGARQPAQGPGRSVWPASDARFVPRCRRKTRLAANVPMGSNSS